MSIQVPWGDFSRTTSACLTRSATRPSGVPTAKTPITTSTLQRTIPKVRTLARRTSGVAAASPASPGRDTVIMERKRSGDPIGAFESCATSTPRPMCPCRHRSGRFTILPRSREHDRRHFGQCRSDGSGRSLCRSFDRRRPSAHNRAPSETGPFLTSRPTFTHR